MVLFCNSFKLIRWVKDQYDRRGGFIRIFPRAETWSAYGGLLGENFFQIGKSGDALHSETDRLRGMDKEIETEMELWGYSTNFSEKSPQSREVSDILCDTFPISEELIFLP